MNLIINVPIGDALSGGSRSLHLVLARPCLDMIAAMLKSVAQGLMVQLSSIITDITAIHDTFFITDHNELVFTLS